VCIGKIDLPPTPTSATGTLLSEVSETKRHNTRRNTERPPAQHLGSFRRELLLHLAVREAYFQQAPTEPPKKLPKHGLPWIVELALLPQVKYTRPLASRISAALAALDELGLVTRSGPPLHRTVRVTRRGRVEAVRIANRLGLAARAYRDAGRNADTAWRTVSWSVAPSLAQSIVSSWKTYGSSPFGEPFAKDVLAGLRALPPDLADSQLEDALKAVIPKLRHNLTSQNAVLLGFAALAKLYQTNEMGADLPGLTAWLRQAKTFYLYPAPSG